jgi:hypothetical protein
MGLTGISTGGSEITIAVVEVNLNAGSLQFTGVGPAPFFLLVP